MALKAKVTVVESVQDPGIVRTGVHVVNVQIHVRTEKDHVNVIVIARGSANVKAGKFLTLFLSLA